LVEDPIDKEKYAIKSMKTASCPETILKEMSFVFDVNLESPFLLKYHGVYMEGEYTHIIMEFCDNGNLEDWILNLTEQLDEKVIFIHIIFICYSFCFVVVVFRRCWNISCNW
jgi:serine/threonine protein kinase